VLFVITADTKAWTKNPHRCWQNALQDVQDFILKSIPAFHKARPYIERGEAIRSGALTAMTIMLAAKSLGYDSCPMIGFEEAEVRKLVRLPDDHVVVMLLPIGKGVKLPLPKPGFIPMQEFLITDSFSN
jgi:nitroreductase